MNKKKLLLCILSAAMLNSAAVYAQEESGDIAILYTNDVHCAVNADEENGVLGYAAVAGMKKELQESGYDVALVDAGDAIQGEAIGTLSNGAYLVDIMNAVGYDAAIPGNHEFDYGMENFLSLTEAAEYPYISCNFMDLRSDETVFEPYTILELGGKKLAFVGITTPRTITSSTPAYFQDENGEYIYGFCQDEDGTALYETVQAAVDAAKEEGAELVIALAHLGIEAGTSPWMSTELIENTTGIDVVLDGHSHSTVEGEKVKNKEGKEVLLTSTGTKLAAVGQLTISAEGEISSELVTGTDARDAEVQSKIDGITAEFEADLQEVVGETTVDLVINEPSTLDQTEKIRLIRSAETNLGDFCADAYRYVTGADIALVNGGGVREDILAGDITYNDIISVHPYGNAVCMVEATGQQVLDALECGAMVTPEEFGGFQQVSGLTYEIDVDTPSSVKLDDNGMFVGVDGEYRVKNVMVGEEPLDPEKTYTVASHNYMLKNGGDGMNMFMECEILLDEVMLDNQALIEYLKTGLNGVVGEQYKEPYGEGRIIAADS